MGKFTGTLLISDYDGTFTSSVPENYKKNIKAVEKFKSEGGLFTFATGRDYQSLTAIEPDFANIANAPVIVANGSRLYDPKKQEYIFSHVLNLPLFAEFLGSIYKIYPDIGIRFSCEEGMVTPVLNEILKQDVSDIYLKHVPVRIMPVKELIDSGEKVYKCVMIHKPEKIDHIKKLASEFRGTSEICFTKTYARGFEAVNINASKGATAKKLLEYLNARDNITYKLFAAGDYDNDLELIKLADFSGAVGNALDEVKAAATVVTVKSGDGAVADFILNYLDNL
jgi:hypothetical protein